MTDPKVLWELCEHGRTGPHDYVVTKHNTISLREYPGGKKYVMRQVESDEIYGLIEYGEDYPVLVWVEVAE